VPPPSQEAALLPGTYTVESYARAVRVDGDAMGAVTSLNRRVFVRGVASTILPAAGLLLTSGCALPLGPLDQRRTIRRVGYLTTNTVSGGAPQVEAFRQGLADAGYREGQDLVVEYCYGEGHEDRATGQAAELVTLNVAAIVTGSTATARAAVGASDTLPVVIVNTSDAVEEGLVPGLSQQAGRVTGLSAFPEVNAKRVELLRDAAPAISRLAILFGSTVQSTAAAQAAASMGLQVLALQTSEIDAFQTAFAAAVEWQADALLTTGGPAFSASTEQIVAFARANRLPAIYYRKEFAEAGGLMAYGPDIPAMFHRAAFYVDRILKGAKPGDLPLERPTRFDVAVNLGTAQALGLTLPPEVAARVTEWVQEPHQGQ
jgi:putative tryptophan/tyrosine transport system substrate-binding protein